MAIYLCNYSSIIIHGKEIGKVANAIHLAHVITILPFVWAKLVVADVITENGQLKCLMEANQFHFHPVLR